MKKKLVKTISTGIDIYRKKNKKKIILTFVFMDRKSLDYSLEYRPPYIFIYQKNILLSKFFYENGINKNKKELKLFKIDIKKHKMRFQFLINKISSI